MGYKFIKQFIKQFITMGGNMPCQFSSMWTRSTRCRTHTEYRFQYTSAAWMFDPSMEAEFADIVQTIRDMGVGSGVYGTFAARACLLQALALCGGLIHRSRLHGLVFHWFVLSGWFIGSPSYHFHSHYAGGRVGRQVDASSRIKDVF